MVAEVMSLRDLLGRVTAGPMYRAWKGWSFADERTPSPFLTLLTLRIEQRLVNN
jgi:hypothetical protein